MANKQVGGDHYQCSYQHWDLVDQHGIPFLEGTASKYLLRYRKKNGLEDLQKSLDYITKIELELHGHGRTRLHRSAKYPFRKPEHFDVDFAFYLRENRVDDESDQATAIYMLLTWTIPQHLELARDLIKRMIGTFIL